MLGLTLSELGAVSKRIRKDDFGTLTIIPLDHKTELLELDVEIL
jgi:hypothetical protein